MPHDLAQQEERAALITVARTWLGTPFHNQQGVKGAGVDCAHLLAEVAIEAGITERFQIQHYSPQFMLHSGNPLFESYVTRFAHEIEEAAAQPGDIVLYQIGRSFAHGAIIIEWPTKIIHAFKTFRCVAETHGFEADLKGRKTKFFSLW